MEITGIRQALKAAACLDWILNPQDEWLRLNQYIERENADCFEIDNGSGDLVTWLFLKEGILVKGFDHENSFNQFGADEWDNRFFERVYAPIPPQVVALLSEEEKEYTTFCMWYSYDTNQWYESADPDNDGGKEYLLGYLFRTAEEWCDWAEEYYEQEFERDRIRWIYENQEVRPEDLEALNPDCPMQLLEELNALFQRSVVS